MLLLTLELLAGYVVGFLFPRTRFAYLISVPAGVVVHVLFKVTVSTWDTQSAGAMEAEAMILAGLLYMPVAVLGVRLAHRRAASAGYENE